MCQHCRCHHRNNAEPFTFEKSSKRDPNLVAKMHDEGSQREAPSAVACEYGEGSKSHDLMQEYTSHESFFRRQHRQDSATGHGPHSDRRTDGQCALGGSGKPPRQGWCQG